MAGWISRIQETSAVSRLSRGTSSTFLGFLQLSQRSRLHTSIVFSATQIALSRIGTTHIVCRMGTCNSNTLGLIPRLIKVCPFYVQARGPWLRFLSLSDTEKKIRNLVLYISKPNYVSSPHSPHSLKASYPIHTCMHAYTHTYAYSLSHSRLSAVSTTKHRFHELGRPRDRAARRPTGLVVDRLPH